MTLTKNQIMELAALINIEYAALMAFISVETGGKAFVNGRIVIQFEPAWFKKLCPFAPSGKWSLNKVENQTAEYVAFSDAFRKNPDKAMQATSWGLGQIMGYHFARLGYKSVGDMVDDFKKSEYQQVKGIVKFIATDLRLLHAIRAKNWHLVATYYNGKDYKAVAAKYNRQPYNESMSEAYLRYAA